MSVYMSRSAAPFWLGRELPRHILYLYKNWSGESWKEYTIYDVIKKKTEKQDYNLRHKRAYNRIIPCYICLHKFSDKGRWYILIQTIKRNTYPAKEICDRIMQIHNLGILPGFSDLWADTFYKKYKRESNKHFVLRAIKFTHCILDGFGNIIDIN